MVDIGSLLADPFAFRAFLSVLAGAITGIVVAGVTFFLHDRRARFEAIRAIRSELDRDRDQLAKLARVLEADMGRQHVDLPIQVPAGTSIEIRYVLSLPGSPDTSAFDWLRQSGRLAEMSPAVRRKLFDLYDVVDRIDRLRQHREALHYDNVENLHVVFDSAELDAEPGTTVGEADLPPDVRRRLDALRRMRRATEGINAAVLRLVASISSPDRIAELGLEEYADGDPDRGPLGTPANRTPEPDVPTIEEVIATMEDLERRSIWSRVV